MTSPSSPGSPTGSRSCTPDGSSRTGRRREVLRHPKHPYTRGLLTSIPDHVRPQELEPMPGVAVGVGERPPGCAFEDRCALRTDACSEAVPELRTVQLGHRSRCLHVDAVTDPPERPVRAPAASAPAAPLLAISGLRAEHRGRHGVLAVARDIEFTVGHGECVALVGESGSGKTTIARTIVGLHPIAGRADHARRRGARGRGAGPLARAAPPGPDHLPESERRPQSASPRPATSSRALRGRCAVCPGPRP